MGESNRSKARQSTVPQGNKGKRVSKGVADHAGMTSAKPGEMDVHTAFSREPVIIEVSAEAVKSIREAKPVDTKKVFAKTIKLRERLGIADATGFFGKDLAAESQS